MNQQTEQRRGEETGGTLKGQQWMLVNCGKSGTRLACASLQTDGNYFGKLFVRTAREWTKHSRVISPNRVARSLSHEEAFAIHGGVFPHGTTPQSYCGITEFSDSEPQK